MDIQKTMESILEQQAASVAMQAVFETAIARLMKAQHNSEQSIARNEEATEVLFEFQEWTDAKLDRLGEYNEMVSSRLDHLKSRVDALVLVVDSTIHRPLAGR